MRPLWQNIFKLPNTGEHFFGWSIAWGRSTALGRKTDLGENLTITYQTITFTLLLHGSSGIIAAENSIVCLHCEQSSAAFSACLPRLVAASISQSHMGRRWWNGTKTNTDDAARRLILSLKTDCVFRNNKIYLNILFSFSPSPVRPFFHKFTNSALTCRFCRCLPQGLTSP